MLLNILLGLLIVVAVSMTGVILLQRSEGGGLVSGGQLMTARGASNLLTRTTQILAAMFFTLSLVITLLTGRAATSSSLTRAIKGKSVDESALQRQLAPPPALPTAPGPVAAPGAATPTAPAAPTK